MYKAQNIRQHFQVDYHYDVVFTRNVFKTDNKELINIIKTENSKIVVVIERDIAVYHPNIINDISDYFELHTVDSSILIVRGGENIKNDDHTIEEILQLIHNNRIDRHSYLIAIGGGAVLDAAGYAAAIAHRGIRLIRVPTTVLSQNDSGVGVKTSINYFGKKNFLGTFSPPYAVINDSCFLETLDDRNWRSGISEAIKVALIKDAAFFNWIAQNTEALNERNMAVMEQLIFRCAQLHIEHIGTAGDPFEKGSSRPLDFGHWAAHKLEYLSGYEVLHGEAVAIGIALDSVYSYKTGRLDEEALQRILTCLTDLGFEIFHILLSDKTQSEVNPLLYKGLEEFREHLGGELTVMLLKGIGTGEEVHHIEKTILSQAVQYLIKSNVLIQE
ncbi:3-dehydroquinate synthase [Flavobacterium supellecticarium]|uniref:3-dehydroquinate synthase n=1 Tax=Flavobacterium supellecticarium TaxID=2565924 RepID=A0A4S4A0H8_9FLAO|nr:3-dehydroquinate synthase [Flavobacterium supellecticarium]THF51697.1 3-dehydroquinate synthase [Flavobacterium supellecticarium]